MYTPSIMPKYLLGTTLIFWGICNGRVVTGFLLAVIAEGKYFAGIRWGFRMKQLSRAWQISTVCVAFAAILIWFEGNRYTALTTLLTWLPVLLLPMQFVQSYGPSDVMPVSVFSYIPGVWKRATGKLPRTESSRVVHFGNIYFLAVLMACCLGNASSQWYFLPVLLLIIGLRFGTMPSTHKAWLLPFLLASGACAIIGQRGIERLEGWLGGVTASGSQFDPNFSRTLIGNTGEVEQSSEILWRIKIEKGFPAPRLLRSGTFRQLFGSNWVNQRGSAEEFLDLPSKEIGGKGHYLLREHERTDMVLNLPRYTLRGGASEESPLPLPGDCMALSDFALDGIESNRMGTVRVYPQHSVIDGEVRWKSDMNPEIPADLVDDLRIPLTERIMLDRVVERLKLKNIEHTQERLSVLRAWFFSEFRYTRNLQIRMQPYRENQKSALGLFLEDVKAGHCEYFATSAVLLLRAAGVPARYATGYAVAERDVKRDEYVIRGTHGHAWCRVWDEQTSRWFDFDCTPPSWLEISVPNSSLSRTFDDVMKRAREDFFVWRNRPENRFTVNLALGTIGTVLFAFVAFRLWNTRERHIRFHTGASLPSDQVITPLHELGSKAQKILGPRPPGRTYADWFSGLRSGLGMCDRFDEAIRLHQRMRHDPVPMDAVDVSRLSELVGELDKRIEAMIRNQKTKP